MNDFLQSKFFTDLKEGKFPPIELGNTTIMYLAGSMLMLVVLFVFLLRITEKK